MLKLCILGMSIALVGGVGVVSMSATHEQNENVVNINRENKKLVSYNYQDYEIILNANELNNYTFENLAYLFNETLNESEYSSTYFYYNENELGWDETDAETGVSYAGSQNTFQVILSFDNNKFILYDNGIEIPFEYDLEMSLDQDGTHTLYDAVEGAIELDIQANMDSSNGMPSIADLFQQVTAAVNAFIGSLGDAFEKVTALFWVTEGTNQGPTFLGLLILIGVGVGLVYLAYRTIRSLIHRI